MRDNCGNFISGFSTNLDPCSIKLGVKILGEKGMPNVLVESDSSSAINLLLNGCSHLHPVREVNQVVDSFVKSGYTLSCPTRQEEGIGPDMFGRGQP